MKQQLLILSFAFLLSGCASSWSTTSATDAQGNRIANTVKTADSAAVVKSADEIIITENDITDKKYKVLGDIQATVNKTTLFHPDPTPELVAEKLKEKAAKMGADAVILARYGTVGVSLMSWGSLEGNGRAVQFVD